MVGDERINDLAKAIRYHRELYYNHAAPEISDREFDDMWNELQQLDPNNSVLHEVGPEPLPGTVKVEHAFPMLSLDKGTSEEEISHFILVVSDSFETFLLHVSLILFSFFFISSNHFIFPLLFLVHLIKDAISHFIHEFLSSCLS